MINDTAAAIIAAQAKELEHLRAQRDELQATCTRLEAEARAAREEMRRVRAATFDPKKSLDRIFSENRTLFAALAKAEREEREAKAAPEQPAAIPSQPKGEDIPKERLPFAWRRTGSRWSLDDVHGDRMGCVILYDGLRVHAEAGSSIVAEYDGDFRESDVLDYVDRVESALVASGEAKPGDFDRSALELESPLVYAAKWERSGHRWVLINGMLIVARLEQNGTNEEFEAVVDGVIVDRHTKMKAAATAEWHARHSGLIPTGHIDRSALNELRREVDPSTHNAARMATRPHLSATLRRRGHAPSDGTRRRRIRGQWRGHQPDRHR